MTTNTENYDQFPLSATLTDRLRASGSRASLPVQLAAAIPQPTVQTQASPSPQMTLLRYPQEVISDGAVGYWHMGPLALLGEDDAVPFFNALIPYFTGATFYGYLLPLTGAYNPLLTGGATPSATPNDAVAFGPTDGATITYFPFLGALWLGSLGFAVSAPFTWEFWIKTSQVPAGPVRILEQESAGVYPYRVQMLASGLLRASRSDGSATVSVDSAQAVNDDAWHYVTVTKNGALYGVQIDAHPAVTVADTLVADTTLTVDGAIAGDGFDGALDELALYSLALPGARRSRHMTAAAGTPVPV